MNFLTRFILCSSLLVLGISDYGASESDLSSAILTPAPPATPRINGPNVFGVRPGSPFLYTIPATGERPMEFSAENLPAGLVLDPTTGHIIGALKTKGEHEITFHARNAKGEAQKKFRIVVGETIALTPPMGWNSWNCWADSVDQEKVLRSAKALVASGLINHGWTYMNIDDTWQGTRAGADRALLANEKFPDLKGLCAELHAMGLKVGIYSTPWVTSYATRPGGSSDAADGAWSLAQSNKASHVLGKYSFAKADARQWAEWGIDYLKYDWEPMDVVSAATMSKALRKSGRDIVFSLSNTAQFENVKDWQQWGNCWRTTCDIRDKWSSPGEYWQYGVSEIAFAQDKWAPYAGPGHWNDPDMLVVGYVGWGTALHPTTLTPDEQYSHISLWCMLSAPLLLGCDLERLDDFTISLLSNDEVLAVDQDALGRQATRVAAVGPVDVYLKELEDGSKALGFFNRDSTEQKIKFDKLKYLGLANGQHVRDLWRQIDLADLHDLTSDKLSMAIPAHGVQLYKLTPIDSQRMTNSLYTPSENALTPAAVAELNHSIRQHRMGTLIIEAKPGAEVRVEQTRHEFWFGSALTVEMLTGKLKPEDRRQYEATFLTNFNAGVLDNAFKWGSMERRQGEVNYSAVDAMLAWADQHEIPLRGHCIFWGVPDKVTRWVKRLNDDQLRQAIQSRATNVASRYRGRFAEYDLNNEMLHGNYFAERLGQDITKQMAGWVKQSDPAARLFLNDYDILTGKRTDDYIKQIRGFLDAGVPFRGIGVQAHSHAETFDREVLKRSLEKLAGTGLPIRITEFNLPGQNSIYFKDSKLTLTPEAEQAKAKDLVDYYRICFAQPAVEGVVMWGFWEGSNWIPQSALYRRDWTPLPAAKAYRDLVFGEWWTRWAGKADASGHCEVPAFYGKYQVTVGQQEKSVWLKKSAGKALVSFK